MVLFTAPEDMIMGNTCVLHSKSDENYVMVTDEDPPPPPHQRHHHSLGNIHGSFDEGRNPIIISSFRPHSRVDHGNKWAGTRIREGAWQEERKVKAGHFTDVYLRSLQKSCSQVSEDCMIEDIEVLNEEDTVDQKGRVSCFIEGWCFIEGLSFIEDTVDQKGRSLSLIEGYKWLYKDIIPSF